MKKLNTISEWLAEQIKPTIKSVYKENHERDMFSSIFFNIEAGNAGVTIKKIEDFKEELEKSLKRLDTSNGIILEPKIDNILGKIMDQVGIPLNILKFDQLMYINEDEVIVQHEHTTEELVAA